LLYLLPYYIQQKLILHELMIYKKRINEFYRNFIRIIFMKKIILRYITPLERKEKKYIKFMQ